MRPLPRSPMRDTDCLMLDPKKIMLRRHEVQVAYDAGFHWLDTRGVVGQKWAYSELFGEFALESESIRLVSPAKTRPFHLAVYGLRNCARLVEGDHLTQQSCNEWATTWITDCLKAGKTPKVRRIMVRHTFLLPLDDESTRQKVQSSLQKSYPGLGEAPAGYTSINSGVSMNAVVRSGDSVRAVSTMVAGIMMRSQMGDYFAAIDSDEPAHAFALQTTHEHMTEMAGTDAVGKIGSILERAQTEAQDLKSRIMIPVVANA